MNAFFLQDLEEGCIDAVIISEKTEADEIERCIEKVKKDHKNDWRWNDIIGCLPKDCTIYDKWSSKKILY